MKNIMLAGVATLMLAGCTATERGAATGAAVGAGVGAIATGDIEGAAIGAGVGAVAGALIGRSQERAGWCVYRDQYGRTYEARCS